MDNLILMVIFGAVASVVISFLKRQTWSDDLKFLVTGVVCLVMALAEMVLTNQLIVNQGLNYQVIVQNLILAIGIATILYKTLFNRVPALAKSE